MTKKIKTEALTKSISFFSEDILFELPEKNLLKKWIVHCIHAANKKLIGLNYIFCSDTYLYQINKKYLQHDYLTDVITFSYAEQKAYIEGESYISIDRVKENATTFGTSFYHELCRVVIHAVLHLLGHNDKTLEEEVQMRRLEDFWLDHPMLTTYIKKVLHINK